MKPKKDVKMVAEEIKSFYESDFKSSSLELSLLDPQAIFLKHFLPKDREINILDAACGSGKYATYLCKNGYKNVKAIDILSSEMYKESLFDYRVANIKESGFESGYFDFVYCFSAIFYLDNIEDGIKEFFRVAKSGATLIITAHTKYSLHTLERVISRKKLLHLRGVRFYSANYYKNLLLKNGFSVEHIDGFNTSYLLYPFYRKISNRFNLKTPKIPTTVTLNTLAAKIRSEISYHSVIVAKKI